MQMIANDNYDRFRASASSLPINLLLSIFNSLRSNPPTAPTISPISVHFDLTLKCDCRCCHCKQWTWPQHGELCLDQIRRLFAGFSKDGVKTVTLGGGEPFLHPDFPGVVKIAKEMGLSIGVISSASYFTPEIAKAIVEYCDWIRISLDGPKSIHDKIRGIAVYDKVEAAVEVLNAMRKGSRLSLGLNCVVQKHNVEAPSTMVEIASKWKVDTLLFKVAHGKGSYLPSLDQWRQFETWLDRERSVTNKVDTNITQLHSLFSSVYDLDGLSKGVPVRSFYLNNKVKCFAPMFFMTVSANGNVYPCDYLQYDTRKWGGDVKGLRESFCSGNILLEKELTMEKLKRMFLDHIHQFPEQGFPECGACTRFCQLNSELTRLFENFSRDTEGFLKLHNNSERNSKDNSYL